MGSNHEPTQSLPLVPDSAPRVQLIASGSGVDGVNITCRRVVTLFGSRDGCKVILKHKSVAPVHLAIFHTGTAAYAVDLVTPNGSMLNGLKMEYEQLSDGDALTIDPWEFSLKIREPRHDDVDGVELLDLEPSPKVIAFEHISTGRILQPNREVCVIGRRQGCDINISDKRVSRVHALLTTYNGRPAIVDLLSKHGTIVNDQPVSFAMLQDHDVLTIGESRFRLRVVSASIGGPDSNGSKPPSSDADIVMAPEAEDQIDIGHVEGSQRWGIADKLEKTSRDN